MDFADPAGGAELREDLARFLAEHLPHELADELYRTGDSHHAGFAAALAERGWAAPEIDDRYTLDPYLTYLITDAFSAAEAPNYLTATSEMVANVIRVVGHQALKDKVLPGVIRGEITIALGMTEPEVGSDVAAVQTKARRDGDQWVIDGSKMFTTNGHLSDYVFLLARTDPEKPNHRGLTTFLVPLDHPGVEVQAVRTLSGERTNITYYSDLRLDDFWRIGEVDQGWGALMVSLQAEHSAAFGAHLDRILHEAEAWALAPDAATGIRPVEDPDVQAALIRAATELEVAHLLEWRTADMEAKGLVPVAEGPMSKLFSTEAIVRNAERLAQVVGPDALRSRLDPTAVGHGFIEHGLRFSVGTTIYAGTSEIQRNIIAQRACGLPRG